MTRSDIEDKIKETVDDLTSYEITQDTALRLIHELRELLNLLASTYY